MSIRLCLYCPVSTHWKIAPIIDLEPTEMIYMITTGRNYCLMPLPHLVATIRQDYKHSNSFRIKRQSLMLTEVCTSPSRGRKWRTS